MRKMGVDACLICTVMALYTDACTIVRTDAELSDSWVASRFSNHCLLLSPVRPEVVCLPSFCMLMT